MVKEEPIDVPQDSNRANPTGNDQDAEHLFSPRFKSIAAMAGWDEEALLVASLIVEDTPDRACKHKKRSDSDLKSSSSTNSRRKRRASRRGSFSPPVAPLNLEEEDTSKEESEKQKTKQKIVIHEENKETREEGITGVSGFNTALPCLDKLREELSCAICLEICYEPSTTHCGHSFCKKCLRSAADKCGRKCPKCRQLISNGRSSSCIVNTVLWNTIQLLFPLEVEARKAASGSQEAEIQSPVRRTRSSLPPLKSPREMRWRRRSASRQDHGDTAIASAATFQREEDDLSRLMSTNTSSRRRRGVASQDVHPAATVGLQREANEISRLLSRDTSSRRRGTPSQDEDAALALRLQREEFMETFRRRRSNKQPRQVSLSLARANLRAMASRAISIRSTRGQ